MARKKPLVQVDGQVRQLSPGDFIEVGKLNAEPRENIRASSTIIVSSSFIRLLNNSGVTQNIDTIDGAERGDILFIMLANNNDNVRVRKDNGNIRGGPNRTLDSRNDLLMLIRMNNNLWTEVSWQG